MREIYLKGFRIVAREAQPYTVMTSYNLINGIHAANHRGLLQSCLRDEWRFAGLVMTDWFSTQELDTLKAGHETIYPAASSIGCIFAGNDLQMPGCSENVQDIRF